MMNWLRDHTKQIMVALVLLAMFSFVGGSALQNLFTPHEGNRKYARIFGETVKAGEVGAMRRDDAILTGLRIGMSPAGGSLPPQHWYMLTHEAAAAGIRASDEEVDAFLKSKGITPEVLYNMERDTFAPAFVHEAVGHWIAVQKNAERVVRAATPSEPEIRHFARDTEEKLSVKLVALDADRFVDGNEVISDADILAHFDKYKNTLPGEGDADYGYKYPDRVRIQCIIADVKRIATQVNVTDEEVKAHWKKNKANYKITEDVPTSQPASMPAASQPASQPAMTKVTREKTFSEAVVDVQRQLREQKAQQLADQAMRKASQELLKPWYEVQVDRQTGYKPIVEAAKAADFMQKVRDQVAAEYGVQIDYMEFGPISKDDLNKNPEFGPFMVAGSGADRIRMADFAFRVAPLHKAEEESDSAIRLQLYQSPDAPLIDAQMSFAFEGGRIVQKPGKAERYSLFRVIQALPSAAPASVDEVKEQIAKDLRRERAYARMEEQARQLYTVARKVGLSDALAGLEALRIKSGVTTAAAPPAFARKTGYDAQTTYVDSVGKSDEFINAAFALAADDWQPTGAEAAMTPEMSAATTKPALSPAPKVTLVGLPKLKKWVVVEYVKLEPVTEDKFAGELKKRAHDSLFGKRAREAITQWFDPKAIEKRCGFQLLSEDGQVPHGGGVTPAPGGDSPI